MKWQPTPPSSSQEKAYPASPPSSTSPRHRTNIIAILLIVAGVILCLAGLASMLLAIVAMRTKLLADRPTQRYPLLPTVSVFVLRDFRVAHPHDPLIKRTLLACSAILFGTLLITISHFLPGSPTN